MFLRRASFGVWHAPKLQVNKKLWQIFRASLGRTTQSRPYHPMYISNRNAVHSWLHRHTFSQGSYTGVTFPWECTSIFRNARPSLKLPIYFWVSFGDARLFLGLFLGMHVLWAYGVQIMIFLGLLYVISQHASNGCVWRPYYCAYQSSWQVHFWAFLRVWGLGP